METTDHAKLVKQLLKLTREERLDWVPSTAPDNLVAGTDSIVPVYFTSTYKGATFGIYEIRRKDYDGDRDIFYWYTSSGLVVFRKIGNGLGFPPTSSLVLELYQPQRELTFLLEAARDAAADLPSLLEELGVNISDDDDQL